MKTLFTLAALCLLGCQAVHHSPEQKTKEYFHYYKDARTNLCFAGNPVGYGNDLGLTCVPCTPDVEKLVEPLPDYLGP
jgi:hypothetical protein